MGRGKTFYQCDVCKKVLEKNQIFRAYLDIFPIGGRKPINHATLGYFCSDCLQQLIQQYS